LQVACRECFHLLDRKYCDDIDTFPAFGSLRRIFVLAHSFLCNTKVSYARQVVTRAQEDSHHRALHALNTVNERRRGAPLRARCCRLVLHSQLIPNLAHRCKEGAMTSAYSCFSVPATGTGRRLLCHYTWCRRERRVPPLYFLWYSWNSGCVHTALTPCISAPSRRRRQDSPAHVRPRDGQTGAHTRAVSESLRVKNRPGKV